MHFGSTLALCMAQLPKDSPKVSESICKSFSVNLALCYPKAQVSPRFFTKHPRHDPGGPLGSPQIQEPKNLCTVWPGIQSNVHWAKDYWDPPPKSCVAAFALHPSLKPTCRFLPNASGIVRGLCQGGSEGQVWAETDSPFQLRPSQPRILEY